MIIYIVRILFMNNYIQSNNELLSELYKQNIYLYDKITK
jgi:hypothetical protein